MSESWYTDKAPALTKSRCAARLKRWIIYDCGNAEVCFDGEHVGCRLGHRLRPDSNDGTIGLLPVLRGAGCTACETCQDREDRYNGEDD